MAFNKNRVMDSARRYVEKGQVDKAIKEYLRVVREDPKDVRVWLKIGDLYAKKGAKPEATETYLKVARFYSEQGFYLKAVAVYKQILKLDPRLIEVNLKLAELYRQLGLMSDAMRHFEMVAGHFHREGKTKEALATVRQLVDLDPENVATRIKLAELYSKEGMVDEAVAEFAHACDYLRANNRQDDFVKVAERLLFHKPDNMALNRELASLYLKRSDPRRALQKLQLCFKANSRDVETLALLAQAFQALEQKSKTVQVLKELARVLDEDGEREQAKEVHRKILAFAPNDPDSLAYVGPGGAVPAQGSGPRPAPAEPARRESPVQRLAMTAHDAVPERVRPNATGSMPLVMEQDAGVTYGDPELLTEEPDDFTAELTEDVPYEESVAAERHSEEIAKVLTETDVYVKYGLHQKAIDHLRRVFALDPENVEARERLKDILLEQGREDEAVAELLRAAESTAARDPERSTAYLRELLALDGTYQPAFDLARRFHLDLTGSDSAMEADPTGLIEGGVAPIEDDIDFGDIEFDEGDELAPTPGSTSLESEYGERLQSESLEFELDDAADGQAPGHSMVTMELAADEVESIFDLIEDESDDLDFDGRAEQPAAAAGPYSFEEDDFPADLEEPIFDPADARAFDAETFGAESASVKAPAMVDDAELPDDAELGGYGEPMPTAEFSTSDFARTAMSEFGATDFDEALSELAPYDADMGARRTSSDSGRFGASRAMERERHATPSGSAASVETMDTGLDVLDERLIASDDELEPLEDDLDEADFFLTQGLYSEARDIVLGLLERHPAHPLLLAKLQDIDSLDGSASESDTYTPISELDYEGVDSVESLDRAEYITVEDDDDPAKSRPTVLLQNPVDDGDADTHYELGFAYKEMGLYDEAIKAFTKVADAPGREVQSRLMIGLCHREQGNLGEAIHHFKAGLHAPHIVEREQMSLYYEIASTYELIGDAKEGMYFYELIRRKDPGYRDVGARIEQLAGQLEQNPADANHITLIDEDPDDILDSLLAETDNSGPGSG